MQALQPKVADLRTRVTANDLEATPKANAAADEIRNLVGISNLTSMSNSDRRNLIIELQKLSPKKQRQLLEDLHMPSTALSPEQRVMQIALYMVMKPDQEFKKADQKIRDKYLAQISGDAQVTQAIRDWNGTTSSGAPLVDRATKEMILKKIVAIQSKAYGIDVPEFEWVTTTGFAGEFKPSTGRMQINESLLNHPNPDGIIETVMHENAHNFQDELVKKFMRGELKKSDPMYEQVRTLAITYGGDAYIPMSEGMTPYRTQPKELHAHEVGIDGANKL